MEQQKEDKILKKIGENIKTARVLKGVTQEYIAEKLNRSTNFVSLVERGKSGVGIKTIIDICEILEIEPNTIFNGTVEGKNETDQYIANSITTLSTEDKEIVINLIEYIMKKGNR